MSKDKNNSKDSSIRGKIITLCPFKAFPRVTLLSQSHVTDKTAGSIVFSSETRQMTLEAQRRSIKNPDKLEAIGWRGFRLC